MFSRYACWLVVLTAAVASAQTAPPKAGDAALGTQPYDRFERPQACATCHVDSDDPNAKSETRSMTLNYLAARNVRLFAEGGGDLEADTGRVSIGLITAF